MKNRKETRKARPAVMCRNTQLKRKADWVCLAFEILITHSHLRFTKVHQRNNPWLFQWCFIQKVLLSPKLRCKCSKKKSSFEEITTLLHWQIKCTLVKIHVLFGWEIWKWTAIHVIVVLHSSPQVTKQLWLFWELRICAYNCVG